MADLFEQEWEVDIDDDDDDDIEELHNTCVNNLAIKRSKIPVVISIPDLYTIYFELERSATTW